jgi:hypothetical protein
MRRASALVWIDGVTGKDAHRTARRPAGTLNGRRHPIRGPLLRSHGGPLLRSAHTAANDDGVTQRAIEGPLTQTYLAVAGASHDQARTDSH